MSSLYFSPSHSLGVWLCLPRLVSVCLDCFCLRPLLVLAPLFLYRTSRPVTSELLLSPAPARPLAHSEARTTASLNAAAVIRVQVYMQQSSRCQTCPATRHGRWATADTARLSSLPFSPHACTSSVSHAGRSPSSCCFFFPLLLRSSTARPHQRPPRFSSHAVFRALRPVPLPRLPSAS